MGEVRFEQRNAVAMIVLSHPEARNSVTPEMSAELTEAYREVEANDSIRAAVISGHGEDFCTGGHIHSYVAEDVMGPGGTGQRSVLAKPWPAAKPFIAAIEGYCVGGGFGLALACDLRVAATDARIGPSGLRRGMVPGSQQIQRVVREITFSKALEILLLSRYLSGEEAASLDLVQRAVVPGGALAAAEEWAERIASFSPWAVQRTKELAYDHLHEPWDDAFAVEERVTDESARHPDALEGFNAFIERREPVFGNE